MAPLRAAEKSEVISVIQTVCKVGDNFGPIWLGAIMLPPAVWACSTRLSRPLEGLPLVVGGSCNSTEQQLKAVFVDGGALACPPAAIHALASQARRMHQEGRTRKDMRTTHATARSKHQAARGAPPSLVLPRSDPELFDFCMRGKDRVYFATCSCSTFMPTRHAKHPIHFEFSAL